jgi:glutathione S-transferase
MLAMPMGQMPVLEVDGKRVHQSLAMCRYIAKQIGVAGKDAFEDLQIDALVDTINEFRLSMSCNYSFSDGLVTDYA